MTSSKSLPSGDSQLPRVRVVPRSTRTNGDLAAGLAAYYGLEPDPWQRYILDDWLGEWSGKWSALTCGLAVPRQNGKNALLEIRELYGAVGLGEKILHTAHEVKTAQKHFRRLKYFFGQSSNDPKAKFPELNALVDTIRSVNGQEAILLKNGGAIELAARSKNSGRGFTVDVLVCDEAQELAEEDLEALMPTTSAAPLGNPQWIFTGTPPGPLSAGEVFTRVRSEAIAGGSHRLSWHEWSPEWPVDMDARTVWRMTNPGLDSGRLQMDVIEGERARFSDDGFARERLGLWAVDGARSRLISASEWTATDTEKAPPEGVRAFGVSFNIDGSRVALAGAVKHDISAHVEVIDAQTGDVAAGIASLADWLATRWRTVAQIAISGQAGAAALEQALRDRGVPGRVIRVLSGPEVFAANAMFYDAVRDRTVTHPKGKATDHLERSVAVCDKRMRSKVTGAWGWVPTTDDGDETPLEAVGFAHWAVRTVKAKTGKAVFA